MPVVGSSRQGPISCWVRVKTGFSIGFLVGITSGTLFGGYVAVRSGLRGAELFTKTFKSMLQAGGTFGTFMAIGSAIRC